MKPYQCSCCSLSVKASEGSCLPVEKQNPNYHISAASVRGNGVKWRGRVDGSVVITWV